MKGILLGTHRRWNGLGSLCASPAVELLEGRSLLSGVEAGGVVYDHFLYYPEGFAGSTITEFLPIGNPNSALANFRVIAHYEADLPDQVLASGVLVANSRGGITISRAADHSQDLVEPGMPYALEVQSTLPLVASLSHYDFGSAAGETFTDVLAETWSFPQMGTGDGRHDFLLWYNSADTEANIAVRFISEAGATITTVNVTTRAMARGGLDLSQLAGLPASGTFAAVVTADQPIVGAVSRYFDLGKENSASTELGTAGAGATTGIVALGSLDDGAGEEIDFLDTRSELLRGLGGQTVTLTFRPSDGTFSPISRTIAVREFGITRFDVGTLSTELVTNRYAVEFHSTLPLVGRLVHSEHGDDAATSFSPGASTRWEFADGFMDPARAGVDVFETIGVSLPPDSNPGGGPPASGQVTVRFRNGTVLSQGFLFGGNGVFALDLHAWGTLLNRITSTGQYFYSVEVQTAAPVVVSMRHYDLTLGGRTPAGGFAVGGQPIPVPGVATYDTLSGFALGHGDTPEALGSVLNVPAGGPGQIAITLRGGVFNFHDNGQTLPGTPPIHAANHGLQILQGGFTLTGTGAAFSLPGSPRVDPLSYGPNQFNGTVAPNGQSITGYSGANIFQTLVWHDGAPEPVPTEAGADAMANAYRFFVDLTDTMTARDVVVTFTGEAFAALGWIPITQTPPPGDGTDGSVWWASLVGDRHALPPLTVTIHIG